MNNKDNYKKTIDQIHASEKLKEETIEKIINKKEKNKIIILKRTLAICAVFTIVFSSTILYYNKNQNPNIELKEETQQIAKEENLKYFKNIDELKNILKESNNRERIKGANLILEEETVVTDTTTKKESKTEDYSKTNIQVENVDESDIVKTDGEYIYYISNSKLYIIKGETLNIESTITFKDETEKRFYPDSLYINKNKLILLGTQYSYTTTTEETKDDDLIEYSVARGNSNNMATAKVYDISNKSEPKQVREVSADGNYTNSRMIGDNIYFISEKSIYYNVRIPDDELVPLCKDTNSSVTEKRIDCTDIAYFNTNPSSNLYTIIGGFNINSKKDATFETFYGAEDITYSSENNLYIASTEYKDYWFNYSIKTTIYKFSYEDSTVKLKANCEIDGSLNNQFSLDEYDGKLRVATTIEDEKTSKNEIYVLDENLKEIGKIEDLALDEKIYSVRFIKNIGYVVTFKEIDPLFIIDFTDPTQPQVKGELKIPGYSSYLHPYDDTHIIGIGNNTKVNSTGGVQNTNMKMSMFDVSDLNNPKEIFNIDIGEGTTYSNLQYDHKTLFYNKTQNLIGFRINQSGKNYKNGYVIYKINLEENKFEKYAEFLQDNSRYISNIQRVIYIENTLYLLGINEITVYDLPTVRKIQTIELN